MQHPIRFLLSFPHLRKVVKAIIISQTGDITMVWQHPPSRRGTPPLDPPHMLQKAADVAAPPPPPHPCKNSINDIFLEQIRIAKAIQLARVKVPYFWLTIELYPSFLCLLRSLTEHPVNFFLAECQYKFGEKVSIWQLYHTTSLITFWEHKMTENSFLL